MKISEALSQFDIYNGESTESNLKLMWLDRIESTIYKEIVSNYEGAPQAPASCFDGERELLATGPYSDLYIFYMAMQSDLLARDSVSYLNNANAFSNAYSSFADEYNRTHKHKTVGKIDV